MAGVQWSVEADAEFDHYSAWIWREASASDAAAWLGELLDWIEQLADFPRIGTPRDDLTPGLRTWSFRKAVVIAYAVDEENVVTILRIFSRGRDITAAAFSDHP